MWKKLTFMLCLLTALFLTVTASAAGETPLGRIEIANRDDSGGGFTCDVNLSGTQIDGSLFAVLFAESGQMKGVSVYPAAETVQVALQGVADTDYIRIVWTDEKQTPLASPAMLRMSGNGASAYAKFAEEFMELQDQYGDIGGGAASGDDDPYVLARLLVSCTELPDLSAYNVAATIKGPDNLYVLQFNSAEEARKCAEYLQTCPTVRYAEPDGLMYADSAELMDAVPPSWGADVTGAAAYAENLRQRGRNGTIVVAVVDSGADMTHPLLKNRLTTTGYDFVDNDNDPQDKHKHGTHVSGIIANCTPDMNVKIMPVRVLDAYASGSAFRISMGIRHAADNGANVINLSLSLMLGQHNTYVEDAIAYAIDKNITVVVAAGNKNADVKDCCPAHLEKCVTVAAVDKEWQRFELSNYGDGVDIAAPGVDVNSSLPGGTYGDMTGTSMAAPHVSAAAALLMEERGTAQTPAQISSALKDSASSLPGANAETVSLGAGFLNLTPFIIQPQRTIVFYPNGGTGSMTPQSAASGSIVALKANTFTRDGYQFTGWNTIADGSGTAYNDTATLTVSQNLSLYAQWEQESKLYALLYTDGEMVFQNGNKPNPGKTLVQVYAIEALSEYAKWYERRADIQIVTFAEKIQPVSTALWFYGCENLKELRNPENLDTSAVTNMSQMFARCTKLETLDLTALNTKNVTNTRQMFFSCAALATVYASGAFDVSNVQNSDDMFMGCTALVGGSGTKFDSGHTDKSYARIDGGTSAPGYFSDKSKPAPTPEPSTDVYAILYSDGELVFQNGNTPQSGKTVTKTYKVDLDETYNYSGNQPTTPWYNERESVKVVNFADKISPKATAYWFYVCEKLARVDNIQNLDTSNVTDMSEMFCLCRDLMALDVSHFDTANVTSMSGMFYHCSGLTALDVSKFDTANVTSMSGMFEGCSRLTALDLSHFDTANVTDMTSMFEGCSRLTALDLSHFDTANVTDMYRMFFGCIGLTALDLSHFDTKNVTDMVYMFCRCSGLTALDVSKFDTANVTSMSGMFEGCSRLTALDVSHFDTANVTTMSYMFVSCSGLTALDVSHFDTANVTTMFCMFANCSGLKTIYASDKFTTTNGSGMFIDCTSLIGGAGTKYDDAHTDKTYARIDGGASSPGYFTRKA